MVRKFATYSEVGGIEKRTVLKRHSHLRSVLDETLRRMATGGASGTEESVASKIPLPASVTNSPTFIDFLRSPVWMYPTSRFFGDALYEYNYDINFIECQDETIQKRKEILYKSYCDLVGCLMVLFCKEYNVESSKVLEAIVSGVTRSEADVSIEKMLNLVRAVYGIDHFSYIITSYCNSYKVRCCQDVMKYLSQQRVNISQRQSCKRLFKHVQAVMMSIAENQLKVKEFLSDHQLILTDKLQRGPFISNFGIKLHDPLFHYESSIAKMRSLSSKVISGKRSKSKDVEVKKVASLDKDKPGESKDTTPDDSTKSIQSESKSTSESPPKGGSLARSSPTTNCDLFVFQFDSNLTNCWSPHQSMPPTPTSPSPPRVESEFVSESMEKPEDPISKAIKRESGLTVAIKSPSPPLDVQKLEVALKKLKKSEHVTTPTGLSPRSLSPTNGKESPFKFSSLSQNVSTSSPPLSPEEVSKSTLSSGPPHTSRDKLKLKLGRSPSPPQFALRSKQSPTSPSEHSVISLPSDHKQRQEYLLNEYDYRIKMHISYQAANFELQNAIGRKKELTSLIFKQKQFEQEWLSTRSKAELSSYSEHISVTIVDEPREVGMEELIKEGQEMIKLLQCTLSTQQ